MNVHRTRQFQNCLTSVAETQPTTLDSIERIVGAMSLADTLRLIGRIANHEKFGDATYCYTERLDSAIADLLEEADPEPMGSFREDAADRLYAEAVRS